jgi:hypothetical protein
VTGSCARLSWPFQVRHISLRGRSVFTHGIFECAGSFTQWKILSCVLGEVKKAGGTYEEGEGQAGVVGRVNNRLVYGPTKGLELGSALDSLIQIL